MVLFTIFLIALLVLVGVLGVLFGDVIIFGAIIYFIVKAIRKRKKKQ